MKNNLLHIVLYLPYGGLEKIVYDFSCALNNKDYEVHVAALEKSGPIGLLLQQKGIPVHVLGKRPGKFDFRLLVKLIKLIRKLQIQVIHSHSGCIMYAALAGKLTGVPTIVHTEHGRYLPDRIGAILEDRVFSRLVTDYVCVSRELEEYIQSVVKVPKNKLITIINGANTSIYQKYSNEDVLKLRVQQNIPPDALVLGTVCRIVPEKNVSFLIEWMQTNHRSFEKLILIVIGDGPQFAELVDKAKGIPEGHIRFLGARKNVADLLNIFDIFTLVSTTEGTSLTILEAMSTQLPVIVSDVGGNKNIINHGKTGYLFECNNQDAFGECLSQIISNPTMAENIGRQARCSVKENFSFEKVIRKYCELYN